MAINYSSLVLPLRVAQVILAIIVLGLSAYVADWWSGHWHSNSPSEINFLVFASVWTLLALIYLVIAPMRFPKFAHIFAILAVEALTMLFWFAGFIALAVWLDGRMGYGRPFSCAKAAAVFAAFEWLLFAATTVFATLQVLSARRSSSSTAKPVAVHPGV